MHRLFFGLLNRAYEGVGLTAAEQINKGLENQQLTLIVRQSNAAVKPLIDEQEDALREQRIINQRARLSRARVRAEKTIRIARENTRSALQGQKDGIAKEIRKVEDRYAENLTVAELELRLQNLQAQQPPDKAKIRQTQRLLDFQKSLESRLNVLRRDEKEILREVREVETELII